MNRAQRRRAEREKKKQQKQPNQKQLFAREPTEEELKAAEAELDRHERYRAEQTMLTTLRAVCYVLNEEYGFGTKRLNHVINSFNALWLKEQDNKTIHDELWGWTEKMGVKTLL